jgi:Tfp pilus assembly protein PilO
MAKINSDNKLLKLKPLYQWPLAGLLPLILVLMLALTYLIYNNYTIDQTTRLAELAKVEQQLKDDLSYRYRQLKSIHEYQKKMVELSQLESLVNQQFPSSDDLPNLLIQINQIAEDANIAVNSLVPITVNSSELKPKSRETGESKASAGFTAGKNPQDSKPIQAKSFMLSATANYLDFTKYIYELAKLPRVIKIDNLHINRVDDNKVTISLTLTIYYSS